MWSRTFALFLRALRVDARALPSHLMRLALLAFVGSMLLVVHGFLAPMMMMGAPGYYFFWWIAWLNFVFATLAAAFLFSASITEEKEERTLGLLRMADVGPLALLVGKSAPRLVAALLILCVQFPFTLLAITMGGVSWAQVTAAFCTVLSHVVLVGGVALLFSVVFRRTGTAIGLTMGVMLVLIVIPPFLMAVLRPPWGVAARPAADDPLLLAYLLDYGLPALQMILDVSAAPRINAILTTGFKEGPIGIQVLTNLGAGAALFFLAWLLFDPCNRNLDDDVPRSRSVFRLLPQRAGRSRRAWRLAIVGKDFRSQAGGTQMLLVKLLAYISLIVMIIWAGNGFRWSRVDPADVGEGLTIMTLFFLLPIESMLVAARLFRTEIKDRTWPLLLSLPLSLPEIAYAKLTGALFALLPCGFYFCLGAVLDAAGFTQVLGDILEEPTAILAFALYFAHLMLFVHLTALFSVISNAWAGALLAIVTSVMGLIVNYFVILMPMMIMTIGGMGGGPAGWGPDEVEIYFAVALGLSTAIILFLAGCVHFLIGVRLKSAAAQ